MDLLFLGTTIGVIGKILLGFAVLSVHGNIVKHHKIDKYVLGEMAKEKWLVVGGIFLMILGHFLEGIHRGWFIF